MPTAIWWIRRDLRLTDNQALHAALADEAGLLPLFIIDPDLTASPYAGARRTAFLFAGLRKLDEDLQARGSRLLVRHGSPAAVIPELTDQMDVTGVYAERDYSPYARRRDEELLQQGRVPLTLVDGATGRPIGSVLKDDGDPYTVFTPYSRRWKAEPRLTRGDILPAPKELPPSPKWSGDELPDHGEHIEGLPFTPGEVAAKQRLGLFVRGEHQPIYDYAKNRDRPDLDATARLSPYLRFGMISARLAVIGALEAMDAAPSAAAREGAATWLNELIWRDFYMTILHYFPHVRQGSFRPEYDAIQWRNDPEEFAAWCEGRTGYPFIDAAMRQLRTSGWMHNRARMAVASFLVKDLLIDWRWGERWFMEQLLDGDPAANNGGWQWAAGTGTDAAPYFRIFNPVSQGTKHDPDGAYVRAWVPELGNVPTKFIHEPWKMSTSDQLRARCTIGEDYPAPIVDHKFARERTLAAYKAVKE